MRSIEQIDSENLQNYEEDESNLICKEDFEERKPRDIITARATPIKSNTLSRKNISTTRKNSITSPTLNF
jgi:hypothetical protein